MGRPLRGRQDNAFPRFPAPDGGVFAADVDARAGWFVRIFGHNTPRDTIVSELEAAGHRPADDPDFPPRQNFLIFEPAPGDYGILIVCDCRPRGSGISRVEEAPK
jgi:hypothetical protein